MSLVGGRLLHESSPVASASCENLFHLDDHVFGIRVLAEDGEVGSDAVHHCLALPCVQEGRRMKTEPVVVQRKGDSILENFSTTCSARAYIAGSVF